MSKYESKSKYALIKSGQKRYIIRLAESCIYERFRNDQIKVPMGGIDALIKKKVLRMATLIFR